MNGSVHRCIALLAFGLLCSPAAAWAPETRVQMLDQAVRMMPQSLRQALEVQREPLLRGMLEPMTEEDSATHRPPSNRGELDAQIVSRMQAIDELLAQPGLSIAELARSFGELAHFLADAGFPPNAVDDSRRYRHFSEFCDSRKEKFPLVFEGHHEPSLASGEYREFAMRLMRQAGADDDRLARIYATAGDPPDPSAFDDRSVPFAVGSLAYSRSITSIVRAWISIWSRAHGDMGRTPYWKPRSNNAR